MKVPNRIVDKSTRKHSGPGDVRFSNDENGDFGLTDLQDEWDKIEKTMDIVEP